MMEELERSFKPSELEVGMVFNENELIIENGGKCMATIRHEEGKINKRKYSVMMFAYILTPYKNSAKVVSNMRMELFPDDEVYLDYVDKLKEADLWRDN